MKNLTAKQIEKIWDSGQEIYVRWSRGPRYDKKQKQSRDYQNGRCHAGLSAVKIGAWADEYMITRLQEYRFLRLKDARINPYIYTGNEIGKDSDGYSSIEIIECLGKWNEK